jgi:hypothetical protein
VGVGVLVFAAPDAGAVTRPKFAIHNSTVTEPVGHAIYARILVTVAPKPKADISVDYNTYPLSANEGTAPGAGVDYLRAAGTVIIRAGTKQANILVRILPDAIAESDELIGVTITNPVGADLGDNLGTITVFDSIAAAPTLDGTTPVAPSNSTTPSVVGLATPFTTVSLYSTLDCSGPVIGTATPGIERMFSIATTVTGYTSFSAITTNHNGPSPCSAAITYDFDTDGDGLGDDAEAQVGSSPTLADTDGDGLTDSQDVKLGTSVTSPDSNGNGTLDGGEDADSDGLTNAAEFLHGSDPFNPDTDGDGISDGDEVLAGSDPTAMQTGTFVAGGPTTDCVAGATCIHFTIQCPPIPDITGDFARSLPAGPPKGVILLQGGSGQHHFFGQDPDSQAFVANLVAEGYEVLQAQYDNNWALVDQPYGPAVVSCRTATLVKYAYDAVYVPLGLDHTAEQCGFCLGGNSSGASVFAYALNRYGLDTVVDRVVFASGPPHIDLVDGCLNLDPRLLIRDPFLIDFAYGYSHLDGPCLHNDPTFASDFLRDSIETSGRNRFPTSAVGFIVTDDPQDSVQWRAIHWGETLRTAGTTVQLQVVADMPHNIHNSPAGLAAFHDFLLGT